MRAVREGQKSLIRLNVVSKVDQQSDKKGQNT